MKGGAYGVFASANGAEGLFSFASYRDPDPARSFGVFKKALEDIIENDFSQELLDMSVIGIIGKEAKPLSPGEKSMMGFRRHLYGITDDLRRKNRQQILEASIDDVKSTAKRLLKGWETGVSVVLGGEELVKKTVDLYPELTERLEIPF